MAKKVAPREDPERPGTFLRNGASAKRGLNRAIMGEAWGQLGKMLEYKTRDRGGEVVKVPAAYSSQECHRCGNTKSEQRESQASFACVNPQCGWTGNADHNAALVIEKRGRAVLAQRRLEESLQDVEPIAVGRAKKRQNPRRSRVSQEIR